MCKKLLTGLIFFMLCCFICPSVFSWSFKTLMTFFCMYSLKKINKRQRDTLKHTDNFALYCDSLFLWSRPWRVCVSLTLAYMLGQMALQSRSGKSVFDLRLMQRFVPGATAHPEQHCWPPHTCGLQEQKTPSLLAPHSVLAACSTSDKIKHSELMAVMLIQGPCKDFHVSEIFSK